MARDRGRGWARLDREAHDPGMIVAPPRLVDALSPSGLRIYEQHLPPARILELIAEVECS
jgi:hypothetical protein